MCAIITTKPLRVAFVFGKGEIPDFEKAVDKLYSFFSDTGQERCIAGKLMGLFYSKGRGRFLVCLPVKDGLRLGKDVQTKILPSQKAVFKLHKGSYKTLDDSFEKIFKFIKERGFSWKFPVREVYIKSQGKEEEYLTEIYVPISTPEKSG
jgi:effector-binding domain-containing protein